MNRWSHNGGWNKTHGTIEETPRIDSMEAGTGDSWGVLFASREKGIPLTLDYARFEDGEPEGIKEFVTVWHPDGWSLDLELSRIPSGFGGDRAFWLCPVCGRRARYLYQADTSFLCRKCARLNYRSQQETRSDCMYYYGKGMALVEKRLEPPPRGWMDGFRFCAWIPERPRYMHQATYRKYLQRFTRYQGKHQQRQMEDVARLLKIGRR